MVFIGLQFVAGLGGAIEDGLNAHLSGLDRAAVLLNSMHAFFGIGALLGPFIAGTIRVWSLPWNSFYLLFAALLAPFAISLFVFFPRSSAVAAGHGLRPRLGTALVARR